MTTVCRSCAWDDCDRPPRARGLCDTHYRYSRRSQRRREEFDAQQVRTPGSTLIVECGDCGTRIGLVDTRSSVWAAVDHHRCEVAS